MRKTIYLILTMTLLCVLSSLSVIGVSEITDMFISDFANPFSLTQSTPSLIKIAVILTVSILLLTELGTV